MRQTFTVYFYLFYQTSMNVFIKMEGVTKDVLTLRDLVCATAVVDIYLKMMGTHVLVRRQYILIYCKEH